MFFETKSLKKLVKVIALRFFKFLIVHLKIVTESSILQKLSSNKILSWTLKKINKNQRTTTFEQMSELFVETIVCEVLHTKPFLRLCKNLHKQIINQKLTKTCCSMMFVNVSVPNYKRSQKLVFCKSFLMKKYSKKY